MGWNTVVFNYKWSADNSVEIEKSWLKRTNIIRGLAIFIWRTPDQLEKAVNRYNQITRQGKNEDFQRDRERMTEIIHLPFVCSRNRTRLCDYYGRWKKE